MKLTKALCLLLLALCLLSGCFQRPAATSQGQKPALRVDMLQADIVPDDSLEQLQEAVWPKNETRTVLTDKAAYDALLAEKPKENRFLSYEDLKFLGDFVSYASSDGDPTKDGFVSPNYAYTFYDPLLHLTWTLYVIEGRLSIPNDDYQPAQDLFYQFRDLYKDSYAEDMRTQAIENTQNVVEVLHNDVLYFYRNQGGKGACKAVLFENDARVFLAVGEFSQADFSMDPKYQNFLHSLLSKSHAQPAVNAFLQ